MLAYRKDRTNGIGSNCNRGRTAPSLPPSRIRCARWPPSPGSSKPLLDYSMSAGKIVVDDQSGPNPLRELKCDANRLGRSGDPNVLPTNALHCGAAGCESASAGSIV